ncbi:aminopeptidase N-like [Anopheles ziemanni]|uniref:aminopeptidase N-like n=1 Tax=Anopheles coustani TaxID=139045 RepID=UPI0026582726|nr:aminopeptidase N-like [Anopheles coustani]XP_058125971.1 aminopeptidase N-like [Anopheles coustani]XP_058125972.1 aminopeptidase N-like [Anopheles coustani]XP_058167707.1 aminopeptidase N-like [Anopheles ziemanni]XP_058167708.1 aminopeptidase N-like [Anopheles ziemanni]
MRSVATITLLAAFVAGLGASTLGRSKQSYTSYRLPQAFRPEHYDLRVNTHLGDERGFLFHGHVVIRMLCDSDATNITLHSKNLTLLEDKIVLRELAFDDQSKTSRSIDIKSVEYLTDNDYAVFHASTPMKKSYRYELTIPFEAPLGTGLLGYYRSSYMDKASKQKIWMSVTQFEPTSARQAFPCFDEPEMKATFDIALAHHERYVALSNMPMNRSEKLTDMPGWVLDVFDRTVPMSTYLVAYSVNDFEYREAMTKEPGDVLFKIWARRDAIDQVDYARAIGPRVTRFYEEYFNQKFPLPKIDMIAVPDFASGAMENWGLITYRETALLYHPNVSTASSKHRVASVIAHELAHQWFGNLVTMRWWTDLWLNEGFATYVASLGVEHLHPEWNSLEEESVSNSLDILKFDALLSSHPVSVEIGHPNQISQIFDAISYEKGSTLIRMMHLFLGEETFRNGVSRYLEKHAYGNAEQDDLWAALTEEAHANGVLPDEINVKTVMDSWTLQTGYPVITVTRNYDDNSATVTQVRFVSSELPADRNVTDYCWWIPLTYASAIRADFNDTVPKAWMNCEGIQGRKGNVKTVEDLPDREHWVVFNVQMAALYKVKYDLANYRLIVAQLNGPKYDAIAILNRAQLIDDAMDLAWTGQQQYGIAFAMMNYLRQEDEYIPWKSALTNLNAINRILRRTPIYAVFRSYIQYIVEPIYERLDIFNATLIPNDRLDTVKKLALIASWACRFDVGDCVDRSVQLFSQWMKVTDPETSNPVPLNLRPVVYCNAIRNGNEVQWNFLWQRYLRSNVGSEKIMIIGALSCTREAWLVERFLDWSLNGTSGVRKQDTTILFASVSRSEVGFHLAKNFFLERVIDIFDYLSPDTSRLSRYIKPLAEQMSSLKELEEVRDLIQRNATIFEKATQGVKQALETIEINKQWKQINYDQMMRFLPMSTARSASDDILNLIDNSP